MVFSALAIARRPLAAAHARLRALWEPPPAMSVSEWAERYRTLPKGTSARPGRWRTETYQREMMDVFDDPAVHRIICVKPTQIGWSEILNNIIGKHIHIDPKPMMLVQPSLEVAKGYGKKRLTPMIQACPELRALVRVATSRRPGNTLLLKEFPGGFLVITGANSGKGLRSDAVQYVLFDEVEAYPDDVDGEGNPLDIGENRTEAYSDFKILIGSTPAKPKGFSRLEKEWDRSDQRRFRVPCPFCGFAQVLWWRDPRTGEYRLVWEKNDDDEVIASSVQFICANCKRGIPERYKQQSLDAGHWVAERPGRGTVGFWLNALYRPWKENWTAMAQKWVNAQGDHEKLKEFITLQLAEFWEEKGERAPVEAGDLSQRREALPVLPGMPEGYARPWEYELIPRAAAVLTCTADIQEGRIEAQIKAWGPGEESWLVAYEVFWGDPSSDPGVWEELERFRLTERQHEGGKTLRPVITLVDSGDQSDAVYDFVMPRQNLRDCVFATKGVLYHAKPLLVQEGTAKRSNVRLFTIATEAAKDRIFSRMKLAKPGAGYLHFPLWATEEYFDQLTAEKKLPIKNKRTQVRRWAWVKTHARNEALDLEVMSLAALFILQNILDPVAFRDLAALQRQLVGGAAPPSRAGRRMRSTGSSGTTE
jgi:phage terminase large subunit GpA-like protein